MNEEEDPQPNPGGRFLLLYLRFLAFLLGVGIILELVYWAELKQ